MRIDQVDDQVTEAMEGEVAKIVEHVFDDMAAEAAVLLQQAASATLPVAVRVIDGVFGDFAPDDAYHRVMDHLAQLRAT